jgi:hypothetical protein
MDFETFTAQAWTDHGENPAAVADRLAGHLHLVQTPAQVAPFAHLAAHVLGEHLGRWTDAIELLAGLQPGAGDDVEAARGLARHAASLRWAAGEPAALAGLDADDRIAALAYAGGLLGGHGDSSRGIAAYDTALAAAAPGLADGSPALRGLAAGGNNLAAALELKADRSPDDTAGMLRAAEGALQYWQRAGTWLQVERAEYRLARCQLQAGQPQAAAVSASRCIALCERENASAFEKFFGHAVLAIACRAAGDSHGHRAARAAALAEHSQVPEADRAWCKAELQEME